MSNLNRRGFLGTLSALLAGAGGACATSPNAFVRMKPARPLEKPPGRGDIIALELGADAETGDFLTGDEDRHAVPCPLYLMGAICLQKGKKGETILAQLMRPW